MGFLRRIGLALLGGLKEALRVALELQVNQAKTRLDEKIGKMDLPPEVRGVMQEAAHETIEELRAGMLRELAKRLD